MLRRHSGQNHFNAKASRKNQLRRKGLGQVESSLAKKLVNYMQ